MTRIERRKHCRARYASRPGELALMVLLGITLWPALPMGMMAAHAQQDSRPAAASKTFPICKRYSEGQQRRQQEVLSQKGAENRVMPIDFGLAGDDTEERILRRRQGNKTNLQQTSAVKKNTLTTVNAVRRKKKQGSNRAAGNNVRRKKTHEQGLCNIVL